MEIQPEVKVKSRQKEKEYVRAVYCHPAYLTYMQSTLPGASVRNPARDKVMRTEADIRKACSDSFYTSFCIQNDIRKESGLRMLHNFVLPIDLCVSKAF